MNSEYLKYGLIGGAILVVLYLFSRGSGAPSSGAVAVDVQYAGPDDSASLGARAQAFSELVGLAGLNISESSALEQSEMANLTAREIAELDAQTSQFQTRAETWLGGRALDVQREVEALRGRQAIDLARFQAGAVGTAAESFRQKGDDKLATYLNALTSIWGAQPVYKPERSNPIVEGIRAVGDAARSFFTFGLG